MNPTRRRLSSTWASLLLAGLCATVFNAAQAADVPFGHKDFYPSDERPVGYRGEGSGWFPGATPPLSFSEKDGKNVRWSVKMPGWGHSTPIVVGKRVITSAEPDTTLCVDADTGKVLWQDALGLSKNMIPDGGWSSWSGCEYSWPCSDGRVVYKTSQGGKAGGKTGEPAVVAYDLETGKRSWLDHFSKDQAKYKFGRGKDGKWTWTKEAAGWAAHLDFAPTGHGSPVLYGDVLIYGSGSRLIALDKATGALRWETSTNTHSDAMDATPLIVRVGPRAVVVTGVGTVVDPKSGAVLGDAIPSIEKDGQRYSRLFGPMEPVVGNPKAGTPRGEALSPITGPSADGIVVFSFGGCGSGRVMTDGKGNKSPIPWDAGEPPQGWNVEGRKAYDIYLAVRLGFDAGGKLTSEALWPNRIALPFVHGGPHVTMVKDRMVVFDPYCAGHFNVVELATGKFVLAKNAYVSWGEYGVSYGGKKGGPQPDWKAPDIVAAMAEFGMTDANAGATKSLSGLWRGSNFTYSRTFLDGSGFLWLMNRQAELYRIDPNNNFAVTLAGALVHPLCWGSHSSPMPHGNRIYVRTFGRLACIGEE